MMDFRDTFERLVEARQLVGHQRAVMNQLVIGPGTSGEVIHSLKSQVFAVVIDNINAWRARFTELQARGLIREVGQRRCKISNRTCIVWAPTGREKPLARHKGHGTSPLSRWKALAASLADDLQATGTKFRSLAEYKRMAK